MTAVFLTGEEEQLFALLSEGLRKEWSKNVQKETLTDFETTEHLRERSAAVSFDKVPEIKTLVADAQKKLASGDDIGDVPLDGLSDEAFLLLMYCIGASGITALLETMLPNATRERMESIAALTELRHRILLANARQSA